MVAGGIREQAKVDAIIKAIKTKKCEQPECMYRREDKGLRTGERLRNN